MKLLEWIWINNSPAVDFTVAAVGSFDAVSRRALEFIGPAFVFIQLTTCNTFNQPTVLPSTTLSGWKGMHVTHNYLLWPTDVHVYIRKNWMSGAEMSPRQIGILLTSYFYKVCFMSIFLFPFNVHENSPKQCFEQLKNRMNYLFVKKVVCFVANA